MCRRRPNNTEIIGLASVVLALGAYLLSTYSVKAYSDPAQWYNFGAHFGELFGVAGLAYGFPLAVAAAIRVVGPYNAFLINIPILLLLVVLIYVFGKWHGRSWRTAVPGVEMLSGAVTVLIFIALNKEMLGYLSSPYRDPLSFLFVLLACILLLIFRHKPPHALGWVAASAASLAAAGSVRETSFLMAAPLLLYAVVEKLRDRNLRFWIPMLVFAMVFGFSCIPFLVQNFNTTGSALVPAQAGDVVAQGGSVVPGIRVSHLWQGIPGTISFLVHHYGGLLCVAFLVGVVFAAFQRNTIVLCISVASFGMYFLFYGGYPNVYARYLFVLDLFAVPIMSLGVVSTVTVASSAWLSFKVRDRIINGERWTRIAGALIFLVAVAVSLRGLREPQKRFTLQHARALSKEVESIVQAGETVISERPLHGIMKCFTHVGSLSLRTFGVKNTLRDPSALEDLKHCVDSQKSVYYAYHSPLYESFVQREYDLVGTHTYATGAYGLDGLVGADAIHLSLIRPWTKTLRKATVPVESNGAYILSVDLGHFSKLKREFGRVRIDGDAVDANPLDGWNYYSVIVTNAPRDMVVRIESDVPVPSAGAIKLQSAEEPVVMRFKEDDILPYLARFSDDFIKDPGMRYPGTRHQGYTTIPTPGRDRTTFVVQAGVALLSREPGLTRTISVASQSNVLFEAEVSNADWQLISFPLTKAAVHQDATRIDWTLDPGQESDERPYLMIQQLVVYRVQQEPRCQIEIGHPGDQAAIIEGMYDREHAPGDQGLHWRWTGGTARLRIIMQEGRSPVRFKVTYFDEYRPDALGPLPNPEFFINGVRCAHELAPGRTGTMKHDVATFVVPAEVLLPEINELRIVCPTWRPREHGVGADTRDLGLMLHSVHAERVEP